MLRFIYRQVALDPARSTLTATAIAAVVAVILVLEGFNEGLLAQLRNTVTDRQADLIVTQAGVTNMIAVRSILPQYARAEVEAVRGVAAAHPLTGIPVIFEKEGRRTPIFLLVYDTAGGPKRMAAGVVPSQPRDIVIDYSLAVKYDLEPGDPLMVSDFEFRIAGIASDAAALFTPLAFARYDDLIDFYFESDIAADISTFPLLSFLLVDLAPGADRSVVAARIETEVPSADALAPETVAANDASLGGMIFGPTLHLLVAVAYLIGVLVTGLTMFATVNARRTDFGVMKALGFSNAFLGISVVTEALIFAVIAIPVGIGLALLIGEALEYLMPLYLILPIENAPVLRTAIACLVFAVAGAWVPIQLIRRLDPSLVFRS